MLWGTKSILKVHSSYFFKSNISLKQLLASFHVRKEYLFSYWLALLKNKLAIRYLRFPYWQTEQSGSFGVNKMFQLSGKCEFRSFPWCTFRKCHLISISGTEIKTCNQEHVLLHIPPPWGHAICTTTWCHAVTHCCFFDFVWVRE